MTNDFPTKSRVHVAIGVRDLQTSRAFYEKLLNLRPSKEKDGYAKFEPSEPALNLSLNQIPGGVTRGDPALHFGIQFKSTGDVMSEKRRLEQAGMLGRDEQEITCCYAKSDKFWVTDPDGNEWEIYTVLADAEHRDHSDERTIVTVGSAATSPTSDPGEAKASAGCAPTGCVAPRVASAPA
jgi:catechol 2,3-dioxygenase-like lactoylglutathione lyase family enzyme